MTTEGCWRGGVGSFTEEVANGASAGSDMRQEALSLSSDSETERPYGVDRYVIKHGDIEIQP
jgi:hypothetical protein